MGLQAFAGQTGWIAEACRAARPGPGVTEVRLPGEKALARRRKAIVEGVELFAGTMEALEPWAEKLGVPLPG